MQERPFGESGRSVSVIGQGTWRIRNHEDAREALHAGLGLGLTHVDTAELYEQQSRSETLLGGVLRDVDRDSVFLASKVLPRNASYDGTIRACDATLARLGTDHLDLYYLHWRTDRHPLADTMRAMERLVDDGKVRLIGVSNFDVEDLEEARAALRRHDVSANQVLYNLEERAPENRLIPYCEGHGIALVAYSPFGSGSFPSRDSRGGRVLADVAERHDATPHQVALNFLARRESVFPIPKAEHADHVRDNARALAFELSPRDVDAIEDAFPKPERASVRVL